MRTLVLSLLLTAAAVGQQPAPRTTAEHFLNALAAGEAEKPPAPGSVDEAVLIALRQHPDIKLAEAKRQMAEAELEQAKLLVAQRVTAAMAKLEQAKANLAIAQEMFERLKAAGGGTARVELLGATAQLQKAKAEVIAAELELNAAKGTAPRPVTADPKHDAAVAAGLRWLSRTQARESWNAAVPAGSVADKLKALIEKSVKFDLKGADLDESLAAVLKAGGESSLTMKLPPVGKKYLKDPPVVTQKGEMPFSAAVQFILDEINSPENRGVPEVVKGRLDVYVREYGLLVARVQDAPPGAPTLAEFVRQVRAEKAEKK